MALSRNRSFGRRVRCGLGQPKVDDFDHDVTSLLDIYHDVAFFDVPPGHQFLLLVSAVYVPRRLDLWSWRGSKLKAVNR
jgi:hypothetical protein